MTLVRMKRQIPLAFCLGEDGGDVHGDDGDAAPWGAGVHVGVHDAMDDGGAYVHANVEL